MMTKTYDFMHFYQYFLISFPLNLASIYLFKANNRNTRTSRENCSKSKIKTTERRQLTIKTP